MFAKIREWNLKFVDNFIIFRVKFETKNIFVYS